MWRVLAVVIAGVFAVGCGDESSSGGNGEQEQESASESPESSCERASRKLLNAIASGLEVDGGGRLRNGFVVRSGDFEKVYMVAADIQGPGLEGGDDIGVWTTNSPQAEGVIYAVDAVAQEFSDWGDADQTDAAITQSADGVDEARSCAEG
jgi:hypothetical protein